ncbi:cell wall biogenesis protein [Steroidobacter denitrificans]|uniref:Cell wall biogenesis protein n=1 Tax=Steroidobacter denitrificans TaxID=465721 RepID=A0A127F7N0_STEDE|nr:DegT/DnrJ/EryC1/StrS family aminotransferase [Steroidobacter denitrificans]AMN46434.1 cell wall biogenesis protein [Steroidobacter denitrificans]
MIAHRQIPFFDYPSLFSELEDEIMTSVRDVYARGAYIMQSDLFNFEAELAAYLGVRHAIGVADGTMGLLLPLLALELKPGDEVLVPSHTFVASAAAIHHAGGTPVLVDCGRDHLIDPASAGAAITHRTKGIMPVQLNGRTADMDVITDIAREHSLFIVEDSCQALGSRFKGKFAGTFGVAGSISFYPSKTLGCFGDGGAVITDDDEMAERVRILRDHGRGQDGDVLAWGFNSRLDNVQAAILRIKLKRYDGYVARRRAIASIYQERLGGRHELLLPPAPGFQDEHFDIFQNYEIEAQNRDELRTYLESRGVKTILQWGGKVLHQFSKLGLGAPLPYAERMSQRFMLLPMNTALSNDDVHYICDCIDGFYVANSQAAASA